MPEDPARALQERMIALVRAFGLHQPERTPCGQPVAVSEAHALLELAREGPMTQHELGRRLRLEKSTVSRLAGILAERCWVERRPVPRDGRAVHLVLTPEGGQAAEAIARARQAKFDRLLEAIPEDRRADVLHALNVLVEAMRESH